ncbi:transposase [Nocardia salmonicida]|uniref:transposase n=1 Tax=Nocardia salmonicida TaxID=53431 RepID=UPI0033CF0474
MAALWIIDDQPWAVIEPLLPVKAPGTPGPARMNDRLVLQGILFVLIAGIEWEDLPQELGFGSSMTCWRRLRDWQTAGVFEAMHTTMLAYCHRAGLTDLDRVIPDGPHVRAKKGAPTPVPPRTRTPVAAWQPMTRA